MVNASGYCKWLVISGGKNICHSGETCGIQVSATKAAMTWTPWSSHGATEKVGNLVWWAVVNP